MLANVRFASTLRCPRRYGVLGRAGLLGVRWYVARRTGWHLSFDDSAEVHASSATLELGLLVVVWTLKLAWNEIVPRERHAKENA